MQVNAICRGIIQTELNEAVWQAWSQRQLPAHQQPFTTWAAAKTARLFSLNRWQTPPDDATMRVHLAALQARNMTRQTSNVDDGFVVQA
ncbi:MAG: hypothetical protein DWI68_01805 [Chloroflexi bacterium]|nr:MAG: hypothetical protein DWI68_01805 [Chloroflexota bacterium]